MGVTNPFISIVIPTFNSAKTIGSCLASVVSQTYENVEIIIVDGLSTDDTIMNIDRILSVNETKSHRLISESDSGIYDAMNKGIKLAKGEWILFLGSDDELFDSMVLKNVYEHITAKDIDFIYGNVVIKGDSSWAKEGMIYDGPFTVEKLIKQNVCHQAIFYRRSLFQELGFFNTQYTICADWDMNHRFFARGKTLYIPFIISKFYAGGESTLRNHDLFTDRDWVISIKKYYGISFLNKLFRPYADYFNKNSNKALQNKNYLRSLYYFGMALYHSENRFTIAKAYLSTLSGRKKKTL